jgi:hypothetical protein
MNDNPERRATGTFLLCLGRCIAGSVVAATALALAGPSAAASTSAATAAQPSAQEKVFVAPGGTDAGACTRAAPCASFQRAYHLAKPGQIVELAGGTYPAQRITGGQAKTAPRIVFRPAPRARVVLAGELTLRDVKYVTFQGLRGARKGSSPGARNKHRVFVGPGSSHVTFDGVDVGSVDSWFANNLVVRNSDLGPCDAIPNNICGNNKHDVSTNVLVEHNVIHDLNYDASNIGAHWECMYINGGINVTIRANIFRGCAIFAIFATIGGPDAQKIGHQNLTIENNWFERPWTENGQNRETAIVVGAGCAASGVVQPALRNVKIRFNSFQAGSGMVIDNSYGDRCQYQNIQVIGNIAKAMGCARQPGWTYAYNVWTGGQTCSSTDRRIAQMPYVNGGSGTAMNYRLTGGVAVNLVPRRLGCPARDIDRNPRPKGGVRCDAGSHERGRR